MKTAAFVFKFIITLVAIVAAFFVAVALIGVFKGISTAEVLHAIGDASIFTREWWTNIGVATAIGGLI